MSEDSGTARRQLRRFTLGSGPLKRGSDRIQFATRVVLVVIVLAAAPAALAVATATAAHTRSIAEEQAADRHLVAATLLEDAPPADGAGAGIPVAATWTAPSGADREGVVRVRAAAEAGTTVTIWVDADGDVTTRPLADADVAARAVGFSVLTFAGTSALAILGYLAVGRLLDRRRIRRWAADWAVVEPVWSRKVP